MKYIVFLTINSKSQVNGLNRVLVGVHATENPDIFDGYIGDSVYINQFSSFKYPKTAFQYAVKKYGVTAFRRETLYVFNNEQDAYAKLAQIVDYSFIKQSHTYNATLGEYNGRTIYQFDLTGKLVREWAINEVSEFYAYPSTRFNFAVRSKVSFLNSFWSYNNSIDVSSYNTKQMYGIVHLYDKNGKWIREFMNIAECEKYLGIDNVPEYIKNQKLIHNRFYVSNKITDLFAAKPRRQYLHTTLHVYKNGEYLGEYKGKEVMNVIHLYSWTKIRNAITLRNGQYQDYVISETKELPTTKTHTSIDVYTKYGKYIETLDNLVEMKHKYNIPNKNVKDIQQGCKYYQDYIFKYNSK